MTAITIKNIGPIEELSIPLPETGGVVVLKGSQGSGKSTALRAVQAASGGSTADLSRKDDARRGEVKLGAVKLTVGAKRIQTSGELEVDALEGRFDLGKVIDPQIKDPDRADMARLKQILSLTGTQPDPARYREIVDQIDPELWSESDMDMVTSDDPVELHSKMVRAIQAEARRIEKKADQKLIDVDDLRKRHALILALPPTPVEDVDARRKVADAAVTRLEAKLEGEADRRAQELQAEKALDEARTAYDGDRSQDIQPKLEERTKALEAAKAEVVRLEREVLNLESNLKAAQAHERQVARLEQIIAASPGETETEQQLAAARQAAADCKVEYDAAYRRKLVVDEIAQAEQQNLTAKHLAELGEKLRQAVKHFEAVLVDQLPDVGLAMAEGRLVVKSDRSDAEPYAELSHGERGILAIRMAVPFVPPGGLCVVSQEVWSGISTENQRLIAEEAVKHKITIVTAQVDDSGDTVSVEQLP